MFIISFDNFTLYLLHTDPSPPTSLSPFLTNLSQDSQHLISFCGPLWALCVTMV